MNSNLVEVPSDPTAGQLFSSPFGGSAERSEGDGGLVRVRGVGRGWWSAKALLDQAFGRSILPEGG